MANEFTISGDFGDTFIRISKEGKVALIFGEDDLSLTEEKSWQNTESYKTAVLFSLMIDSFIKNGKALDDLILNSPTGSIPAELIGKGYVDIELAGAGFEEPYVEDVPDEPKEKYTDNVLQFKLKNKKDDNEDD